MGVLLILGARSAIATSLTALAGSSPSSTFLPLAQVPLPIGEFGLEADRAMDTTQHLWWADGGV